MLPVWMTAALNPISTKPVGQMQWTTPGTYQWTVPPGVKSVSCLVVGGGRSGYVTYVSYQNLGDRPYGGLAPNYVFKNDIAVTPGQVLTITVGSGGTNATGTGARTQDGGTASTALGLISQSNSGAMSYGPASGFKYGNNSGTAANNSYVGPGSGLGVDLKTGLQTSRTNAEGALCGGGGSASVIGGSFAKYKGGDGGVRIIWGENRGFPNNSTQDMQ